MRRALVLAIGVALAAAAPAAAAPPPAAHVWVTTPDGAMKMSDRGSVPFRPGGSDALTISVDPSRRYQTMEGFGASITDSSARVLYRLDRPARNAAMRSLFAENQLSFLRQPIGASDFVEGPHYTYDDLPAGRTDYRMRRFSIAHDRAEILPLLRQALALNPQIKVIGSPWSPPAWMKTNQSLVGGRLIDTPRIYAAYARYLVKFVKAYRRAGVPIYALTVQNEPQNRKPRRLPRHGHAGRAGGQADRGARPDAAARAAAHEDPRLRPQLVRARERHRPTPPGEDPEVEYPTKLLQSRAGRWLAGTAFHCYAGEPSRQTELQHAFPDKGVWFTECSGSHGPTDPPAQVFSDTLKWHTRNLVLGVTRNWGKTVVNWNLALDPAGGPHNGGCDTCSGVVTVGPGQTVTQQRRVLHARPSRAVRAAGRRPDREHVVRDDRLERPDHGRGLPQPRRLDRARRPQRERRSAQLRGDPGRLDVRVHAARRRARDVHSGATRCASTCPPSRSTTSAA